ncbi:bifunctional oligoribonuclease/PAP phosphatase NrnA [Rhodococcus sp. 06-156-3C]|uniref:DHH family phosphoesterase n=1 Tax=Nocardiaceae TaxID=85025 RepID=UPI000522F515|nr:MULTISPECIES: bifunctional oligoribonuclease/PAP phosphatase NrnA [Rhodococcus]OZD05734.1 bifunctional oligoribonuclease/PAP phosphatase NrnA [Rhodococcus sp. 06-156-4C]OZD16848.1 bifunctional oligoribonuclease/PAP phosphatase NrnA [Rhodococcus sp. 06-156-4a]OZD26706.1 bifunctional oligoribonuclease/PAP phosphatase NrnA [Rhodococcus sp. 06-156-3C]OZD32103.1 bifunctional oligoribonuclease/PAP phosphatase NrnA [Rhodococcus sp. 06-156-3b]OZD35401.1 bifunctional oligoribonuclease/PAP phosphatas
MTTTPGIESVETELTSAVSLLDTAQSVTVLCHVHPDADTIGSGLALALVLHRRGVPVQVSFAVPDTLPESMNELPGCGLLVPSDEVRSQVDLVVTVDAGSRERLGSLASRIDSARASLVIDHHRSNTRFGSLNVVDADAESTTAVITRLLDLWNVDIDAELAHCLFAGLVTDTGSFRWVRPGSHLLAERLLATGIDGGAIARKLLDSHPFGWLPMLGSVLGSATLVPDAVGGRGLVYAAILRENSEGLRSEEIESVIDIVRTTTEAEVAAVLKQQAGDEWTVSLRSKASVDVSSVAATLGGGGHRNAAGFTAFGSKSDVIETLTDALG